MPDTHPRKHVIEVPLTALGATTSATVPIGVVPFNATVESAEYIPSAGVTGNNTNTRTLTVQNRGAAGSGTTATAALALVTGVNPAAYDSTAFTLDATAANRNVDAGHVLALASVHASSGLAEPGGLLRVTLAAR